MELIGLGYIEIFLALFCFFLFYYFRNPNYPINYPIFGMVPEALYYIQQIHKRCTMSMKASGGTFLFKGPWFANMDVLATVDPSNVHYIMSSNFMNFPKGPKFKEIFDVLGNGIFNADYDMWKVQRKTTRALITHHEFYKFLVKTSRDKVEKGLIPVLDHVRDKVVDLQDLFQRFTFDTTCILITGYDPGCLSIDFPDVPFSRAMDDVEEVILIRHALPEFIWKLQRWIGIGEERKMIKAQEVLDYTIDEYISRKREDLKMKRGKFEESEEGFDLLTFYLKEEENLGAKKCDDKFLRDNILNLMIAGRDTTSSALTWFVWLVSKNPQVEKKIRDELASVISNEEEVGKFRLFNVQELNKLVYLHGALCESLRLYPPVPFQHKEPLENDTLPSGHKVHPKMKIMFPLYAMGRMESIWGKDCLEFKPERWISERGMIKHEPSYKFMAFNAGPRTCLGKEVAFTQMKAVAAAIIHNYQVEVVKGHPVKPNASIILFMKYGFKVRINRRWT